MNQWVSRRAPDEQMEEYSPSFHINHKPAVVVFVIGLAVAVGVWLAERSKALPEHELTVVTLLVTLTIVIAVEVYEINVALADMLKESHTNLTQQFNRGVKKPVAEFSAKLERKIEGLAQCQHLGRSADQLGEIMERAGNALVVRNTFVCFGLSDDELSKIFGKEQIEGAIDRIRKFVADHRSSETQAHWTDIVSQDVINAPVEWLSVFHKFRNMDLTHGKDMDPTQGKRYTLRRLKQAYPIINFMILDYGSHQNKSTEVIFGQGHHTFDGGGEVFRTEDEELVGVFERFWQVLESDSDVIDHESRPVAPIDIEGIWFRAAYIVPEDLPIDPERIPEGGQLTNVALVTIRLEDGRNLQVSGEIYEIKNFNKGRDFKSVTADLMQERGGDESWRLWFPTEDYTVPGIRISGFYAFPCTQDYKRAEEFYGEFQDKKIAQGKKYALFGKRITDQWLPGFELDGNPKTFPAKKSRLLRAAYDWWITYGERDKGRIVDASASCVPYKESVERADDVPHPSVELPETRMSRD